MNTKKNTEFKIGEIVVYPKHGVGEIISTEIMEIANIKIPWKSSVKVELNPKTKYIEI